MRQLATTDRAIRPAAAPASRRPAAYNGMKAMVNVLPYRTQTPRVENREAMAYIAHLTAHCHPVSEAERAAILAFAQAWVGSVDIRREFGSFSVFASYMRGRKSGATRGPVR